jgi:hypothetical protein
MTPTQTFRSAVAQEWKTPSPKCETPVRGASDRTESHGQNNKESWQ